MQNDARTADGQGALREPLTDVRRAIAVVRARLAWVVEGWPARRSRVDDETYGRLLARLDEVTERAVLDRARATADSAQAALDRADAAREIARLESALRSAHLDDLTGAYRRDTGRVALSNEIDRARRTDGRFVLAFVDVDMLKIVNDRDGHAAGDRVLQTVVRATRSRLRSFDPIVRYGGDEFVCGLTGADLTDAERRFQAIGAAIQADAGVTISVGLAALMAGESIDQLTERADATMLALRAERRSAEDRPEA